jgi:hypothetical protein
MPQVGFEPTIPVFEKTKRVHALDRAAAVIGFVAEHLAQISNKFIRLIHPEGHAVAISRKVAGWSPDEVDFFN